MELQGFVQRLALHLTSWQATTFLIGEYVEGEIRDNPVFTVADGLFWLYQQVERNSIVRKLQVMKLRGQASVPGAAHLPHHRRRPAGLPAHLRPHRAGREGHATGGGSRTGIAELDAMMGGGIPEGDSLLVAGPSGSGKSVLGDPVHRRGPPPGRAGDRRHLRGTARGVRGAGRHVSASTSRRRSSDGKLNILYLRPLDLSVDETVHEIIDAVGADRAPSGW